LPPERELIDIFLVSRPSLREALRSVSILGVVEARHGDGARVTNLDAKTLLSPLDFFLSLTTSNLADAFDSRRVIEMEMVRRTALVPGPERRLDPRGRGGRACSMMWRADTSIGNLFSELALPWCRFDNSNRSNAHAKICPWGHIALRLHRTGTGDVHDNDHDNDQRFILRHFLSGSGPFNKDLPGRHGEANFDLGHRCRGHGLSLPH
jgi:Bacterial regulatory proteins, gntR family